MSLGALGLILQLCFIYWFSAHFKSDSVWHQDGTAIYYVLNMDHFTRPLGKLLLNYPSLLEAMTHVTMWFETFGPALVFITFCRGPLRLFTVLAFLGFHATLALCLDLDAFSYACMIAWLALLPTWFWNRFAKRSARRATPV